MPAKPRKKGEANSAVAEEIKVERTRRKARDSRYTQAFVADRASIALQSYKNLELGNAPIDVDQLFSIAAALEVRPSELVERAEGIMASATVSPLRPQQPAAPSVQRRAARKKQGKPKMGDE